ncbi:ligand-binding sensor domain-containing diguanylate cyclase [Pseudolysobacter antarcticus]|nr:ligand-binding sensor domain-containing diguanylate cyclase [Pseudolysobacter antarcticus]
MLLWLPHARALETVAGPALTAESELRWTGYRRFSSREGLPQNSVSALAQDRDGFVYAGTEDGVARYDGRSWRAVPMPDIARHAFVLRLLAGADGSLWVGTDQAGLVHYAHGVMTPVPLPAGATETDIEALAVAADDAVYVGTSRSLYRCDQHTCRELVAARGLEVAVLLPGITADGPCLWIGTNEDGLYRLDGISRTDHEPTLAAWHLGREDGLPNSAVRALVQWGGKEGRDLWIGTGRGLARLADQRLTLYTAVPGIVEGGVSVLLPGTTQKNGAVLYAGMSASGLAEIHADGSWLRHTRANGLPEEEIRSLLESDAASGAPVLWVGSRNSGIARRDVGTWSAFDERNGLPHRVVHGIGEITFPDGLHTHWISTSTGAVRWRDQHWEAWLPAKYASRVIYSMIRVGENIWVASNRGLIRIGPRDSQEYNSDNSKIPGVVVNDVSYDADGADAGSIWIGTHHGIARLRDGKLEKVEVPPLRQESFVRVFAHTALAGGGSQLWAAGEEGIAYRRDGNWSALPQDCLAHVSVMDLREQGSPGANHALWVAHRDGVTRIDLDHDLQCTTPNASVLPTEIIYQLQLDRLGRVYLFGYQGVVRLTPDATAPGDVQRMRSERFTMEDGLPAMEFNRGASLLDSDGRIWADSIEGAVLYDPAAERAPPPPRPLRLLSAQIEGDGANQRLRDGAVLDANANNVVFEFALLSYQRDHLTRYRTELEGLDETRDEWTATGVRSYNRLPAGDFTFRVYARDGFGVEAVPITLKFSVRLPWWRTPWAVVMYALALIAFGMLVDRWRTRALERRARALEAEVALRTRALADANDQLQRASLTDPLTGLWNRRYFDLELPRESERALQRALAGEKHADLTLVLLDLDHFKSINDRYGHPVGDAVLVELAVRLQAVMRSSDLALRWGGEEFLIVFRDAHFDAAAMLIKRLLAAVSEQPFIGPYHRIDVTCSIGWAMFPFRHDQAHALSMQQVLALADEALYRAKDDGRNCAYAAVPDGKLTAWQRSGGGAAIKPPVLPALPTT